MTPEPGPFPAKQRTRPVRVAPRRMTIPRRASLEPAPLSLAQQRLWFIQQIDRMSSAYNQSIAFRVQGPFDLTGLEWALNEVVRRHDALRTAFAMHAGRPVQRVVHPLKLSLPIHDLGS